MAVTSIRARLGDTWTELAYNPATGRWEGVLTPPGTSANQPGGYFRVDVEASGGSGETAAVSGGELEQLRLVVRETAAPVLGILSPAPGYLTTGTPVFTVDALDEEGGSGVDPESFAVSTDGLRRGAGPTWTAIPGGYRFSWTPPEPWGEGGHTVTFSVRDRDGNESAVSAAYTVDTVPPELYVQRPYMRHVVDSETITVAGMAWDGGAAVTVTVGGTAVPVRGQRFEAAVPLEIGENHIRVTAADGAGNTAAEELYVIRLVTDRTKADVERVLEMCGRGYDAWTAEERTWWASARCLRGSYDDRDLNRVGTAVRYLAGELRRRGYIANVPEIVIGHAVPVYETDADGNIILDEEGKGVVKEVKRWSDTIWIENDAPVRPQMETYLSNVETVRGVQGLDMPEIPGSMRKLGVEGANRIEAALAAVDAVFPKYAAWTAGEITCGGV